MRYVDLYNAETRRIGLGSKEFQRKPAWNVWRRSPQVYMSPLLLHACRRAQFSCVLASLVENNDDLPALLGFSRCIFLSLRDFSLHRPTFLALCMRPEMRQRETRSLASSAAGKLSLSLTTTAAAAPSFAIECQPNNESAKETRIILTGETEDE